MPKYSGRYLIKFKIKIVLYSSKLPIIEFFKYLTHNLLRFWVFKGKNFFLCSNFKIVHWYIIWISKIWNSFCMFLLPIKFCKMIYVMATKWSISNLLVRKLYLGTYRAHYIVVFNCESLDEFYFEMDWRGRHCCLHNYNFTVINSWKL